MVSALLLCELRPSNIISQKNIFRKIIPNDQEKKPARYSMSDLRFVLKILMNNTRVVISSC